MPPSSELTLGDRTPEETQLAVLELKEWYERQEFAGLPLQERVWMEALSREELRLLWFAGQPEANYLSIAEGLGVSRWEVEIRLRRLRRKLQLHRKAFERLGRDVVRFASTITSLQPSQN